MTDLEEEIEDEAGEIEEDPTEGLDVWPDDEGFDADGDGVEGESL